MSSPSIQIETVSNPQHPLWQVLLDQKEGLAKEIPIFKPAHLDQIDKRTFLVATLNQCIVGITSIRNESPHFENAVGVGYISAHKQFRNIGVATAMVKALFTHAKLQGKAIANSPYEPDGKMYLEPVMQKVSNAYPTVELIERDYWL